jgi:hypothetical protein
LRPFEAVLGIKIPAEITPRLDRLLAVAAPADRPTSAVTMFVTPLGVEFLAIVVLLLFCILVALAIGSLFKVGLKAPWKDTLLAAGAALVGTFLIGSWIIGYLMPQVTD